MTLQTNLTSKESLGTVEPQNLTRSCDMCRKKKKRCEPMLQGCVQCSKSGTRCHFTPIASKRKPRRPASFKYITQLEERIQEVEGILGADNGLGLSAYGWQTSERRAGNLSQQHSIGQASLGVRQQLPSKDVALGLVHEMLANYNRFLPLFDEEDFVAEFQLKYSTATPEDACWWACLNIVLSIAHRLRALSASDPVREDKFACGYIQNAMDVVSELNVRSLSAVQALVGMACVLQGTPNPEPASMLVAAALRLAQAMNLHRESSNLRFTAEEAEKRRRVFWKVYILDKDVSLRTSQPFSQDDDDMDVRLPSNSTFEPSNVDLFNRRIGLALVQGQVYKQLYSVRAERQTAAQRAIAAQQLCAVLSYWKSSAQFEVSEHSKIVTGHQVSGEMTHRVVMRLTYIHCLTMIDRHLPSMSQIASSHEISRSEPPITPGSVCLAESRQAISLIEAIPHSDCVWMLLHALFAAANNLLYSCIGNPTSPNAASDLHLVKPFLRRLETLAKDPTTRSRSKDVGRMHRTCSTLENEADQAVQLFSLNSTVSFPYFPQQ